PSAPVTSAPATSAATPTPLPVPELRPRFELHIPSFRNLIHETRRSNTGFLLQTLGSVITEAGRQSSQEIDVEQALQLLRHMEDWPDAAIDVALYAPNREGRPRWAARIQWPVKDLRDRVAAVLESESAQVLLKEVAITAGPGEGYTIALPESTLAYVLPAGENTSLLTTFDDVEFPDPVFEGTAETHEGGTPLLVCRLNLAQTERDSGATFSAISFVTDVVYGGRVDESGNWVETIHVHWPPISGLGAKTVFDKVKQTFFVPDEAFGSLVANSMLSTGILQQAAGVEGESPFEPGPVAEGVRPEVCITVLPGTGVIPVPDVVFQARLRRSTESFLDSVRAAIHEENTRFLDREETPPWHEETVDGRVLFWKDAGPGMGGSILFSMRTVLFLTKETDAGGRERDILVIGSTSTSPDGMVKRWLNFPRHQARRFLPAESGTRGQAWVNWRQVYRHAAPYLNITISSVSRSNLLPDADEVSGRLTDGIITTQMQYAGMAIRHEGPVPAGILLVPALAVVSTMEGSGGTDLARERNAARKLKVLYHHARLFRKDVGRWPAEVRELDGYVDFAGNRHLLRVERSSKQAWREFGRSLIGFGGPDARDDEEDEDDVFSDIDDSIYVIEWGRESWRLGFAPGTFDHLDRLFIDENGEIHRVEKSAGAATSQPEEEKG
ncbi:MAG: hypothetical protein JXB13_03480, partial [Phycisphaerae bacterium]|nr:hypothetical protein [Phycisphaerae bacterium]